LERRKIIDAQFDGGVLCTISTESGKHAYDLHIFRFDSTYRNYDVRIESDVTTAEVNFVTLESGVCIRLVDDGELEVMHAKMNSPKSRLVKDPSITGDMTLVKHNGLLAATRGNRAYKLRMR